MKSHRNDQKGMFFCMHPFVTFGKGSRFDQVCSFSMFLCSQEN